MSSEAKVVEKIKNHVAVCLDGSDYSKFVVEWCAEHIFPWAGKVTFLHAYSFSPVTFIPGPSLAYSADAIEKSNQAFEQAAIRKGTELLKAYARDSAKLGEDMNRMHCFHYESVIRRKKCRTKTGRTKAYSS
mmetsp:Transcript_8372/g.15802  ORF Transcript_8372/g.15802 Transcript_8372/m.15802 type:complete len:132 (+) Transcript_8372:79-474(+)